MSQGASASSTAPAVSAAGPSTFEWQGKHVEIRNVWASNVEEEMANIRELLPKYNYIAMDTEFPGIVARPVGSYASHTDYQYQTLRCNVDLLRLIQLGITLSDSEGNMPDGCPTWQFNFQFDLKDDMYASESIDLLRSSGIDFARLATEGIAVQHFGELLMTSGMVLMDDVRWITFHSGYDFGYLLKLLTAANLPADDSAFFHTLHAYFPYLYDVKQMCTAVPSLSGGLSRVANALGVPRVGQTHQAGSDSFLTSTVFFAMVKKHFNGRVKDAKHRGVLYGLSSTGNHGGRGGASR